MRGGGEPNLSWERLGAMLRALRAGGIATISGDLVLDRSLFSPGRLDVGAPPFDDTPDADYNVIPDALIVSDNLITYELSADAERISVQTVPPLAGVTVENHMILNDRPCAEWKEGWRAPVVQVDHAEGIRISLVGSFPRNCKGSADLNTLDRNLYIGRLVKMLWQELGGKWQGRVREGVTPPDGMPLLERRFETLAETIRLVNKNSDAFRARLVYLTLGATARTGSDQPTLARANRRVLDWLLAQGVDTTGIVIENGSGLSRVERLSPAQLAALLAAASRSRWYAEFASSLPIVAVDGTVRNRMKGTVVAGNARLKTGTLRDVAALAGYVRDVHRRDWIVVGIVNDEHAAKGRSVLDRLLVWVADGNALPVAGVSEADHRTPPREGPVIGLVPAQIHQESGLLGSHTHP